MMRTLVSTLAAELITIGLLATDCTRATPPPSPPVVLVDDAGGEPSCASACVRLQLLGCPEGSPSRSGVSCQAVCESASTVQRLPLACVEAARTIEAVRRCNGVRCIP